MSIAEVRAAVIRDGRYAEVRGSWEGEGEVEVSIDGTPVGVLA